ncbi:hypothetical protein [Cryobacterium sp. Y62]|uniref:hypothetical protein n=1 Tax=Cryobacterium sp. Y62 TaxID=2048284 RepID=UPI000CE322C1|nr:hypothetical protein [Cryobacterium sp. Y62]
MAAEDSNAVLRRNYARKLMTAITRNKLHSMLKVRADDGSQPIIVALGSDCLSDVGPRIRAAGGSANLIIVDSKLSIHIIDIENMRPAEDSTAQDVADIHKDITMEFLIDYMRKQPGGSGLLRFAFSGVDISASSSRELQLT